MTGTPNQIQMADLIRPLVEAEFDRVANAFRIVALNQQGEVQAETAAILSILAKKRGDVLSNTSAGYYITTWREISDQVRQLIFADPAYKIIQRARQQRAEVSPLPASV